AGISAANQKFGLTPPFSTECWCPGSFVRRTETLRRKVVQMAMGKQVFQIGYNVAWRFTFFVFAVGMLAASVVLLIQSLLGTSEGLFVPASMLVAAILMSLYLIPFISF